MKPHIKNHSRYPRRRPLALLAPTLLLGLAASLVNLAPAQVPVFTNIWNLSAGNFTGLPANAGNNCRGIAVNPVTTNVLYFSSTGGTNGGNSHVGTLAFADGSNYLANLNSTGVSGGTVGTEGVRVSDDGFVYGINLSGAPASNFKIYRWPADTDVVTPPTIVYDSGPGTSFQWRLGDYMDLRGSGIDTEIVVVGNGSGANITTNFVIFRPTDASATSFTNFSITIPGSSATVNLCGAGVTFEGTNNAIWIRRAASQETRRVAYDPVTLTATVTATNTVDQSTCQGLKYFSVNGVNMLATVQGASGLGAVQRARVFSIPATPTGPFISVMNSNLPALPTSNNANSLGNVDTQKGYLAFGAPGHGISFYQLTGFVTNTPPLVGAPTGGGIYVEGFAPVNLSVTASGPAPLSYQWYFNTNTPIVGATTNALSLGAADVADAGTYNVIVTNLYGSATSTLATVTVVPAGYSTVATQIWTLAPGSRDYLTTGDTQRGLAYDPVSESLVLVSRSPTNGIHVLSAATGADLGELDISLLLVGTPPGTLALNMAGVADDGAVYVANLITSGATDNFAIYRWADTTNGTPMGSAYFGNPGLGRIGDTFAARGAGVNTELLASFRTGTNIALFTTADGTSFNFNPIAVTNLPPDSVANGFAGLGLAFGSSNTFWAKSSGFQLRQLRYDLAAGTAEVIYTSPNPPGSVGPIGVDAQNGILAGVGFGQIPQNLSLYDLQTDGIAALIDRESFPANNANPNGTGAVAFDVKGGRLFSLDSNSGILALNYAPRLYIAPEVEGGIVTWTGPGALQASANVTGTYTNVIGATSPYTNTAASSLFFRVIR